MSAVITLNVRESGGGYYDVRDLIERLEELEEIEENSKLPEDDGRGDPLDDEEAAELAAIRALLEEIAGYGGDEEWRGEWYPLTLIPEGAFEDYCRELAEDCGMLENADKWPCYCIDWEWAAREARSDYGEVDFNGSTYLYR